MVDLNAGKQLTDECIEILRATAKTGLLARRKSSVARVWNPKDGHGTRSITQENPGAVGATHDIATNTQESIHDIYLANKTPEEREKVTVLLARSASRGGKVRGHVDEKDIQREIEKQLKKRESGKAARTASTGAS